MPAVSGGEIRAGGVGGDGIGAGGFGGEADAPCTGRSFGTAFTRAAATVTGGGNGGASVETGAPATSVAPLCAKATVRAESNSRVSFP